MLGIHPTDQWVRPDKKAWPEWSRKVDNHNFSELGRKLMCIDSWDVDSENNIAHERIIHDDGVLHQAVTLKIVNN